mmetsp:Transcript_24655/g.97356  ORF Transcript_24655/g.97356 Transcript_24655/m.97356 type:complete len:222 (-) Transcript_24655:1695-2360(-)
MYHRRELGNAPIDLPRSLNGSYFVSLFHVQLSLSESSDRFSFLDDLIREKLEGFLEKSFEAGTLVDGVIAQDKTQMDSFWALREGLPEALLKEGAHGTLKYDVSLPMKDFYALVTDTRQRLSQLPAATVGWGHIGDGNLHLNVAITQQGASEAVKAQMDPFLYEWVKSRRGSISAEHGLGLMKAEKIYYTKPKPAVDIMKLIKNALDPNGILNPHKVLPRS